MKGTRFLAMLLALVTLISAAGCTKQDQDQQSKDNSFQPSDSVPNQEDPVKNAEGIDVFFENIDDSIVVSEMDWYRDTITVYTTKNAGLTKQTANGTLVYGLTGNIQGAYPPTNQQENVWSFNVYESLFQRNTVTGELDPWLATAYEFDSEGNLHLTLREGVKFHDGTEMTAEDVLFTLKLSHDDPKARAYQQMQQIDFDHCVIEDDYHLTLVFYETVGSIIDVLASGYCHIMSKDFVEKVGPDFAYLDADAGTGAYYLVETVTDISQTFKRFEDYWGGCPEIETIIAKRYTDETVLFIDYVNGQLDYTLRVSADDTNSIMAGKYGDTTFYRIPDNRYKKIFFNTNDSDSPTSDIRVRQAIAYALNYEEMVYAIFGSYAMGGDQMTSIFMPGISYQEDIGKYEYDPERAVELLAEAGYDESNPCKLKLITSASVGKDVIAELMQGYLAEVGIELELDLVKSANLKDNMDGLMEKSPYDILINTGDFANGSPTGVLAGSDAYGKAVGEYNPLKGIVNEEFHELYAAAERTNNETERTQLYREIQQLWYDNVWLLPLLPDCQTAASHPWVKGINFTSGYTTRWADLYIEQ